MHPLGSSRGQWCVGPEEATGQVLDVVVGLADVVVVAVSGHPVVVSCQVQLFDCELGVAPLAVVVVVMEGHTL